MSGARRFRIDQLEQLEPAQLDELAGTMAALYRRVAEPPHTPQPRSKKRTKGNES